ncbi:hypothetical protein CANARDRAFT_5941 [[Candida] arabinofermentans NRRL YB-2248]|uniref:Nuclear fusion protein KAR5 n=1 Tax=[Candida] arabinofermentans NRRL YB-2248 TaxID=983967 RepID=A0A1E4T6P2_9ASCO|nr:hypothetical protein CANARDRAFT_5941 [[Candida] arabinofermentans NRRL YB-2248]
MKTTTLLVLLLYLGQFEAEGSSSISEKKSIQDFLEQLQQTNTAFLPDLFLEDSCSVLALSVILPKCSTTERSYPLTDLEKSRAAIELTKCIFSNQQHSKKLPSNCIKVDSKTQDTNLINKCLDGLAKDPVLWTTYFGYLNTVEQLCYYYNAENEKDNILAVYADMRNSFEVLLGVVGEMEILFDRGEHSFIGSIKSRLFEELQTFQEELKVQLDQDLKQAYSKFNDTIGNVTAQVESVNDAVDGLETKVVHKVDEIISQISDTTDKKLIDFNKQWESNMREVIRLANLKNRAYVDDINKYNDIMRTDLKQRNEKLVEELGSNIQFLETQSNLISNQLSENNSRFQKMIDSYSKFDSKLLRFAKLLGGFLGCVALLGIYLVCSAIGFERLIWIISFLTGVYSGLKTMNLFGF